LPRNIKAREPTIQQYLQKVQPYFSKQAKSKSILITYILKEDNHQENFVYKLVSSNPVDLYVDVWVEVLEKSSVSEEELMVVPINIEED
jgi:hypothetical protein